MPTKKTAHKRVVVKKPQPIEPAPVGEPGAVPLLLYRRIALTFIVIVAAALITILYLSTVQAVIHIDSTQTPLTTQFITDVMPTPESDGDVRGAVVTVILAKTQTFKASGESKKQIEGTATGEVTITNNLTFAQSLVATTRLLSSEGVLFRLKEGVSVPAGGQVTAQVYADQPGATGDIQPTRFTIPGLSAARQEAVYAESSVAFKGGVSEVAVVSAQEIEEAVATLQQTIVDEALTSTDKGGFAGLASSVEVIDRQVSIQPEEEAAQFDVTLNAQVTAVVYDRAALETIATRKLYEGLGQGQQFAGIDKEGMVVEIAGADEASKQANIRVTLQGTVMNATTSKALDVDRFVGLPEGEVRAMLMNEGLAQSVDVEFFPFWIRTIPRLKDHVYIDIR